MEIIEAVFMIIFSVLAILIVFFWDLPDNEEKERNDR